MATVTVHTDGNGSISVDHVETPPESMSNRMHGGTASYTLHVSDDSDFSTLLEYQRHAGSYSISDSLANTQNYHLTIPTSANINSLLWGIEPDTDLSSRHITGVWGLVKGVTDGRTTALTHPVVEVELGVLAEYSEYSTRSDVENALEY